MGIGSALIQDAMTKVYVGNLDHAVDERDLDDVFGKFGRIESIWVARKPPGFAFVTFEDDRDADDACRELDGREMDREHLTPPHERIKVEVSRGRGGGGGGGGDGGGGFGGGGGGYGGKDGGKGGQTRQAGDWDCARCGYMNFASRDACNKCGEPKPSGTSDRYDNRGGGGDRYDDRGRGYDDRRDYRRDYSRSRSRDRDDRRRDRSR